MFAMIEFNIETLSSKDLDALADDLIADAQQMRDGAYKLGLFRHAAELRLKAKLLRLSSYTNGSPHHRKG